MRHGEGGPPGRPHMPMSMNSRRALLSLSPLSVTEIKRSTREHRGDFEVYSVRHAALFTHCDRGAGHDWVEEIFAA